MERISFNEFRSKFIIVETDRVQTSMLAPIVYGFDDDFFNAILKYLEDRKETNLVFDELSVDEIKEGMRCNYIQAVCILHNIKLFPQSKVRIFKPYIKE